MGVSFAISGIGQMLAPSVEPGDVGAAAKSNILNGNINSTKAGAAVPLVYGFRVRTGSSVIAADVEIEETL
jgi:predicted phage tail protein